MQFIVAIFLFFLCTLEAEMLTRKKVMMGTFATVKLDAKDKHHFKNVYKALQRVDDSLSSYKNSSPIYKLNKYKQANINLYTYEALHLSEKYYKQTQGYFNIAIGAITKDMYRFGEDERLVSTAELNTTNISLSALSFNERSARIKDGIKIDLGGMGKGFGLDRAFDYLRSNAVAKGSVALSGDIRCLDTCKIDIQDPFAEDIFASFTTKYPNMGITTSGNYNRYVKEKKNNHLIDPKTKKSEINFASITLIGSLQSADIDAYSTAASVMPKKMAYRFLDSLNLGYIVVQTDKKVVVSENIDDFVDSLLFYDRTKE